VTIPVVGDGLTPVARPTGISHANMIVRWGASAVSVDNALDRHV